MRANLRHRYGEAIAADWAASPDYEPGSRRTGKRPKHVNLLDRLDSHRALTTS